MSTSYDSSFFVNVCIDKSDVDKNVNDIKQMPIHIDSAELLIKIIRHIDLTTLNANDTRDVVQELCNKAVVPISIDLSAKLFENGINLKDTPVRTAAVCVYPSRVCDAVESLKLTNNLGNVKIASVAAGFPSGQYPLKTRLMEIECCIEYGANEIDIVIDRSLVLTEQWEELYKEIKAMKDVCRGRACMKTILAVGELRDYNDVYKASMIAMMAGSDFIKTSTGKETVNATLEFGYVMCRAIKDFHSRTGIKVGLKPAGGIRTMKEALCWFQLVKTQLDSSWLTPSLFRIGASGLLQDLQINLFNLHKL